MTSRPAAPESETPETDKIVEAFPTLYVCSAMTDLARSLERRLSLANEFRAWYEEAMKASNEAGYAGMDAAGTIRDLDQQHSLAQTEIKGHMRVVDDLQAEVARLRVMVGECRGWLEAQAGHRRCPQVPRMIDAISPKERLRRLSPNRWEHRLALCFIAAACILGLMMT